MENRFKARLLFLAGLDAKLAFRNKLRQSQLKHLPHGFRPLAQSQISANLNIEWQFHETNWPVDFSKFYQQPTETYLAISCGYLFEEPQDKFLLGAIDLLFKIT